MPGIRTILQPPPAGGEGKRSNRDDRSQPPKTLPKVDEENVQAKACPSCASSSARSTFRTMRARPAMSLARSMRKVASIAWCVSPAVDERSACARDGHRARLGERPTRLRRRRGDGAQAGAGAAPGREPEMRPGGKLVSVAVGCGKCRGRAHRARTSCCGATSSGSGCSWRRKRKGLMSTSAIMPRIAPPRNRAHWRRPRLGRKKQARQPAIIRKCPAAPTKTSSKSIRPDQTGSVNDIAAGDIPAPIEQNLVNVNRECFLWREIVRPDGHIDKGRRDQRIVWAPEIQSVVRRLVG